MRPGLDKLRRLDHGLQDERAKQMPSHLFNESTMKLTMKRFGMGGLHGSRGGMRWQQHQVNTPRIGTIQLPNDSFVAAVPAESGAASQRLHTDLDDSNLLGPSMNSAWTSDQGQIFLQDMAQSRRLFDNS